VGRWYAQVHLLALKFEDFSKGPAGAFDAFAARQRSRLDPCRPGILSWSDGGTMRLWDAATGQPLGAPMKHGGKVGGAVFDKAEGRVLSWSDDGTVRLRNVARLWSAYFP